MSKRIIVGYDGSGPSREAIAWAAAEAETRGVGLHLVSCYHIPVAGDAMYGWALTDAYVPIVETTENSVAQIRSSVADTHTGLEISTKVSAGPAGPILVDEADPDGLIVVGASSHEGGIAAFWLGSIARRVVRHSQCHVVVVRGRQSMTSGPTGSGLEECLASLPS